MAETTAAQVKRLRSSIDHPVVDGDGHLIESLPAFAEAVQKVGGPDAAARLFNWLREHPLMTMGDAERGDQRGAWWGVTNDALDLATVMAPRLLAERLEEIGLDYAILYPTLGLALPTIPDDEMRRLACRAINTMNAELTRSCSARLTAAACIPMHTPEEAIDELRYVRELGFKVASIPPGVARPWPAYADAFPAASFVDRYGIDSRHDYDPVWRTFVELSFAVTSHGAVGLRYLDSGRRSPSNYMFNHIMGHAYQQGELAKSLVLAGVPRRFPQLTFGFLEGGAGWACDLLHSLEEHWEKRSAQGLEAYDPARLDRAELRRRLEQYGIDPGSDRGRTGSIADDGRSDRPAWARDEFEPSGIDDEQQFAEIFGRQLFFGCEADDRGVFRALDGRGNPFGLRLNAFFSSDIGHWDVPDLGRVVLESRKLVEKDLLAPGDYRDFVFTNPVLLHARMNPRFFEGTAVEEAAQRLPVQ